MGNAAGTSYALQLPFIGSTEVMDSYITSLGGYWSPPIDLSVYVNAGGLPLYDRIDVARPALTGSGGLSSAGQSFIWPSATWTNLSSASRAQFLILVIGALIGIFGSAPVAVVIEWIRGPKLIRPRLNPACLTAEGRASCKRQASGSDPLTDSQVSRVQPSSPP